MFGLLLIYFIWKHFSELAAEYNKTKWHYALLGIASYYLGTILCGVAIGLIDVVADTNYVDDTNNFVLSLISLPFGILSAWGLYKLLESKWKNQKYGDGESLDHELLDPNMEG